MDDNKQQLRILFVWSLLVWILAGGLMPLLPVYARRLGAPPALVGYYMAFAYVMIAAGSLYAGKQAGKPEGRRRWLIMASAGVPLGIGLMALTRDVWQLAGATALAWLCLGLMTPISNTLIGLRAAGPTRGRVFGTIGMTQGIGTLIGGTVLGPAADAWTYRGMFFLAALIGLIFLLAALFIRDAPVDATRQAQKTAASAGRLGWRYWALLGAVLLVSVSNFTCGISRSLMMNDAGLAAAAISSTASITGLVGLVAQPGAGWISDRFGRRSLLAAAYVAMALALWLLSLSTALWQFYLVATLVGLSTARLSLRSALVADTLDADALGMGNAYLAGSNWIGGIIGFGLAGNALQTLGPKTTLLAAALLPVLGIGILTLMRTRAAAPALEPETVGALQTGPPPGDG